MTKIKNTKKGMAKKTLSISLAVAMLATSNVPVWAAEFTDGTATVETPATDFTSEAETPVVEEAPASEVNAAEADFTNPKDDLALSQSGWNNPISVHGDIYNADGESMDHFFYEWVDTADNTVVSYGFTRRGVQGIDEFIPGKTQINHTFVLKVYNYSGEAPWTPDVAGTPDNYVAQTNAVTIGKADISNGVFDLECINNETVYNGKDQKIAAATLWSVDLEKDDFNVTYSTNTAGDYKHAGVLITATATPKDSELYTGKMEYNYRIQKKEYEAGDIAVTYKNYYPSYEYTGNVIKPAKSDLVVTDRLSGEVIDSSFIKSINIKGGSTGTETGDFMIDVTLDRDIPNFTDTEDKIVDVADKYNVAKRDLSKCTVEIQEIRYNDWVDAKNEDRFKGKVSIYDENHKKLNLVFGVDYDVVVTGLPENVDLNTPYKAVIQAADNGKASGSVEASFVIVAQTLDSVEFDDNMYARQSEPYTGETITKDINKLGKLYAVIEGKRRPISPSEYAISFEGKDVATGGKIVITGKGSFEGSKAYIPFEITPAEVELTENHEDISVAKKVVYNKAYTSASQYKPSVTVKAHNTAKPAKEFALEEGKDYKVVYSWGKGSAPGYENVLGRTITTKIVLTNSNFVGVGTTDTNPDTFVLENATTISKRQLSNCTIQVVGESYTYTGAVITPTLKVMDGNDELVKDVDYVIDKIDNGVNVGTATVTIKGKSTNEEGGALYDDESKLSADFEITAAKAEDVKVEFAKDNTGVTYTGKALKPAIVKVTLNGNDVTQQFDVSYPYSNINVGDGKVLLTPVTDNKNFTGTKDAVFQILPRELNGELKIYNENGADITDDYLHFAYDGKEHTFAQVKFIPDSSDPYSKYVTENDYEIKYVDNVYGPNAQVYVIGKGNFAGNGKITNTAGDVISSVVDSRDFDIETYEILKQHVTINDGEYAAGQAVKPDVMVVVGGKILEEGKDYELSYKPEINLTNGKTMKVVVRGINGYNGEVNGYFAIVQKDMKNTQVVLDKDEYKAGEKPVVTVYNSGIVVSPEEYDVTYSEDSLTVTAKETSKNYTGTQTVKIPYEGDITPSAPVISNVSVIGNRATVDLFGEAEGATGYDYVISKDKNCIENKNYADVNKNILSTNTTFNYAQQGTYYAYCHAWVRDENGKKVFSGWSNAYPFVVSAITPDVPKITGIKVKGSTVTVTYTACANATGYDVVLGGAVRTVAGEKRPVNYGTLVKKNIKGNTVTATFKNVPEGTYYAGLHAFNRTSEDGKKVFSPWSASKTVTVK